VSFCTAVGYSTNALGNSQPLIEQRIGGGWQVAKPVNPNPGGPFAGLAGVTCSGPSSCLAVGGYSTPQGGFSQYSERWNGEQWSLLQMPAPNGAQWTSMNAVTCASARFCIAAGAFSGGALIEQWDGAHWHLQSAPSPSGAQFANLFGVSCPTTSACVAVGNWDSGSLAERWNGHSWQIEPVPLPHGSPGGGLFSVSCVGSDLRCIAVGGFGPATGVPSAYGARRTASGWTLDQPVHPPGQNALWAVACRSASLCSAVGQANTNGTSIAIAQRWNGNDWADTQAANPLGAENAFLNGVACPGATDCLAVGATGPATNGRPGAIFDRWNGHRWQAAPVPTPTGAELNDVACAAKTNCMAVGGSNSGNLGERWDGTLWNVTRTPTPPGHNAGLGNVACTSATFCMAVGAYCTANQAACNQGSGSVRGETARWNGHRWTLFLPPNPTGSAQTFLNATSCTSPSACTTIGQTQTPSGVWKTIAERWNGTRWQIQTTPNPPGGASAVLIGLVCTSATDCLAVGASDNGNPNLAERWNGTNWRIIAIPSPPGSQGLYVLSCSDANACTAVGPGGTSVGGFMQAERWDGTRWQTQSTPLLINTSGFADMAVSCPTAVTCVAVGGMSIGSSTSVPFTERWTAGHSTAPTITPASIRHPNCPESLVRDVFSTPASPLSQIASHLGCDTAPALGAGDR
jgi:hypothetical protein